MSDQSTTLMECTWHEPVCVLEEPLPLVEVCLSWEDRGNFAAVAWPTVSWKIQQRNRNLTGSCSRRLQWRTDANSSDAHLGDRMIMVHHGAHGRSHAHHLQVAVRWFTDTGPRSDASGHSLRWFLLPRCHNTTADLKNITEEMEQKYEGKK